MLIGHPQGFLLSNFFFDCSCRWLPMHRVLMQPGGVYHKVYLLVSHVMKQTVSAADQYTEDLQLRVQGNDL